MLLDYRRIRWWNVSYVFVNDTFGKRTLFEGNHPIRSIGFQLHLLGQKSKSLYKKICKRYRWVMFIIYYFFAYISRSAHQTPNFTNPEFQFPQFKVLQSGFFLFNITCCIGIYWSILIIWKKLGVR